MTESRGLGFGRRALLFGLVSFEVDSLYNADLMLWIIIFSALFFQPGSSFEIQGYSLPTWQQYRVDEIYRGKTATPVFETKEEREFRSQIRRQAAKGPNFAGHYTVVSWGCGTECTRFVVVDAQTGRIVFHAQREEACAVYYKLGSRLIVTDNRCADTEPKDYHRSFWEWSGTEMRVITKIPIDFQTGPPKDFQIPQNQQAR